MQMLLGLKPLAYDLVVPLRGGCNVFLTLRRNTALIVAFGSLALRLHDITAAPTRGLCNPTQNDR